MIALIAAKTIGEGIQSHGFDAKVHLLIGIALATGALLALTGAALAYFGQSR